MPVLAWVSPLYVLGRPGTVPHWVFVPYTVITCCRLLGLERRESTAEAPTQAHCVPPACSCPPPGAGHHT